MARIYLDCCCFGRLFDDRTQQRVREEAECVEALLAAVALGRIELLSSEFLLAEIRGNPSDEHRSLLLRLLETVSTMIPPWDYSRELPPLLGNKLSNLDACHVLAAQRGLADAFLTVDDVLLRRARACGSLISVPLANPVEWARMKGGLSP